MPDATLPIAMRPGTSHALLLLLASCEPAAAPPLRLGVTVRPGHEILHLARSRGLFAAEGLDVRLVEFSALGDVRRAFELGQVDGMSCTLVEQMLAQAASARESQIVLATDWSDGADVIVARRGIGALRELAGGPVAIEPGTFGTLFLARALARSGMSLGDVRIVAMAQPEMARALAGAEIDAAVMYPPASLVALRASRGAAVFSSRELPREIVGVVAIDPIVLARSPGTDRRLARAGARALALDVADRAAAWRGLTPQDGIDPGLLVTALEGVHLIRADEQSAFIGATGVLRRTAPALRALLREIGQLGGADRDVHWMLPAAATVVAQPPR